MAEITTTTVREAIDEVKAQFGEEGDVQITDAHVIRWINRGARDIAIRTKFLQKVVLKDLVADVPAYDLGNDVDRLLNIDSVRVSGSPIRLITDIEADESVAYLDPESTTSAEIPSVAWIDNGVLNFHPKPSRDVTNGVRVKIIAYPAKATGPTDLIPVPDRLYNTLISFCIQQAQQLDAQPEQAKEAGREFEESMARQSQLQNSSPNSSYAQVGADPDDSAFDSGWGY